MADANTIHAAPPPASPRPDCAHRATARPLHANTKNASTLHHRRQARGQTACHCKGTQIRPKMESS